MARRKYSVDEALIARYLKEGRGTGFGADYKPWLKIYDVPSLGRSHRLRGIKTGRVHHFLSDIEANLFYLLDWHDAVVDTAGRRIYGVYYCRYSYERLGQLGNRLSPTTSTVST